MADVRPNLSTPLVPALRAAFDASGLTIAQLIAKAGLGITEASMSRKLSGDQSLRFDNGEAAAVGAVLGLRLEWTGKAFRFRKDN